MRSGEERSRERAKRLRREMTRAEAILWNHLRIWPDAHFRKQHPIGPFIADFACARARLLIEV